MNERLTEWLWMKLLNVALSRPRVQATTGQIWVEEFFPADHWMALEGPDSSHYEMLTKKISYIIEKLSSSAANYEDENKVFTVKFEIKHFSFETKSFV